MPLRKDIWRPAIVEAEAADILARGSLENFRFHWLPEEGDFRFLADPFGLWRDGQLHVFVETYDYRVRLGSIEVLTFDGAFKLLDRRPALIEPWHLSYPQVIEAGGEIWMLPEASRSGGLTLYRATEFPYRWEPAFTIELGCAPIDATPVWHEDRWWLFYSAGRTSAEKTGTLHCAWADELTGPWTPHPRNPIGRGKGSSRPGGTAISAGDRIILPVQDCGRTYGGAIRPLNVEVSCDEIELEVGDRLTAPRTFAPYIEGLHTFAAAGPVTLVDAKRTDLSLASLAMQVSREWRRLSERFQRR